MIGFKEYFENLFESDAVSYRQRAANNLANIPGKYRRSLTGNVHGRMVSDADKRRNDIRGKLREKMKNLQRGQRLPLTSQEKDALTPAGQRTVRHDRGERAVNSKLQNMRFSGGGRFIKRY